VFRTCDLTSNRAWRIAIAPVLCAVLSSCGGGAASPSGGPVPEKRCGDSPETYFSIYNVAQLAEFADCTVLVGRLQEDSVRDLQDFAALKNVWKVEGVINLFRSPGFLTLHGLENLQIVEGNLFVHLNENLMSVAALEKLHTVTGDVLFESNPLVPRAELDALDARVTVGGTKTLR